MSNVKSISPNEARQEIVWMKIVCDIYLTPNRNLIKAEFYFFIYTTEKIKFLLGKKTKPIETKTEFMQIKYLSICDEWIETTHFK